VRGKDLFLLGAFRRRLEYPALKRAAREQQSQFDANVVLIEDKASGTQLNSMTRRLARLPRLRLRSGIIAR
jgi:hypothetical protein